MSGVALSGAAFATTIGSLAPHDATSSPSAQRSQQWVTDPLTKCVAADPDFDPDDSISWQGQCHANMVYGPGTLTFLSKGHVLETITGAFTDGLLQPGHVEATWSDGTKYDGDQLGGLFNGAGKFVSAKGDALDGEWKMGVLNGKANATWSNGDRYDGEWKNGRSDGHGVEVWADGRRYEGEWRDGVPVGGEQVNDNATASAVAVPEVSPANAATATQHPSDAAATAQSAAQLAVKPVSLVAPATTRPTSATPIAKTAAVEARGNDAPNPALPLRSLLGTQLVAVDGASLELGLTDDGFERTLVLPNGNSQETEFAFANGPVGTVSDGDKAIGVFRANASELDIDYADGATEVIGEGSSGGLVDRARNADGGTMCTAWYAQGHVFSQSEKQAAVQEYASRLGVSASAPSAKHRARGGPACGGAFIASGSQQKTTGTEADDKGGLKPGVAAPRVSDRRAETDGPPLLRDVASSGAPAVSVRTSAVHLVDSSTLALPQPLLEQARFAPGTSLQSANGVRADAKPSPEPGAADCLTITSNGEYWGFQNRCTKSVQFSYCEMSDANPLTSCKRTSVSGSVAANGFSALVSDRSLSEKSVDHEFRWMACDGGAGEVVAHLDRFDPPSGRCERAVAPSD